MPYRSGAHRAVGVGGRSPATAERAAAAGLTDAGTVAELARRAEILLSVRPPHAARSVAESVSGFVVKKCCGSTL